MTPRSERDLFNSAAELFMEALDRPIEERDGFLDVRCGEDSELRRRVSSLLAHHEETPLLERTGTAWQQDDTSQAIESFFARRDSRYRILGKIGEGGMSVVYRAEDSALGRVVALKFLASHLALSPGALERFENEAKAAAALAHPNICPIYDIGEIEGRPFIVMEHLEGLTLSERLQRGRPAMREVVEIAIQVCRGLSMTHRKGIVHRDIKPANLMLTEIAGQQHLVRILDFGIAQLAKNTATNAKGMTVGTVSYMAPEQIHSSAVDGRADLWALGVVMYRMLAGELPFQGDTTNDVAAAIAGADPKPLSSFRDDLPPALDAIVSKAMCKEPDRRYQNPDEFLASLMKVQESLSPAPARGRTPMRLAIAAVALLAVVAILRFGHRQPAEVVPAQKPVPFTSYLGEELDPAISPDGTKIAFAWTGESQAFEPDIYVQAIGSTSPLRLTNTASGEFRPVWSPGGNRIAFLRFANYQSRIVIVPATGGPERHITAEGPRGLIADLDWSPVADLAVADENGKIIVISMSDGKKRQLTFPKAGDRDSLPKFDPSGSRVAFLRFHPDESRELFIIPAAGGEPTLIGKPGIVQNEFCWTRDGTALLLAGHRSADGGPLRKLSLRDGKLLPLDIDTDNAASPDVKGSLLAYTRRIFDTNIWAARLGPDAPASHPAKVLIASSRRDHSPQFSPDGQSIVFASIRSGQVQLWRSDNQGRNPLQITSLNAGGLGTPRWSPDGRWIAFDANLGTGAPDIYTVDAAGGGVRRITHDQASDFLPTWASDSRSIYFCSNRGGKENIWNIPFEGGGATQVTRNGGWESFAASNGKYLYYSTPDGPKTIHRLQLETGEDEEFPELGDAGAKRYWALTDKGIYFVNTLDDPHWIQYFDLARRRIAKVRRIGDIIRYGPGGLAVSPDGKTALWPQVDLSDQDIMLVKDFR